MSETERSVFHYLLRPDDSYDGAGEYWADMSVAQRVRFVSRVDRKEARRELGTIWDMIKNDPLSPIHYYFHNFVIPGAGLGLEGYVLFSIGNVRPLLQATFPSCWDDAAICDKTWLQAIDYLEICGIIVGQILVGIVGDWIGRRWGLLQDALIMLLGLLMLTAAWGTSQNGWVICYAWSLFVYGIGVGGEYPMTATAGMENAVGSGKVSTRRDRLHRGRQVTGAFLMQGWGQFSNQVILILSLIIFHHGSGNPPYSQVSAQWTYRLSFAIPAAGTLWLFYYRKYKMRAASRQLQVAKRKAHVTGYDTQSLKLALTHFPGRLLATAGAWFINDVFFYGNKLFQNEFIAVLTPNNSSVMVGWLYNLINVGVSLCGYYCAMLLIDNKLYGRKWMMIVGFMLDFVLFVVPAFNFDYYTSPAHVHSFQAMYFLSSFFNQFGPNSVTFLVAAEVFPTPIRATAHGFSAAMGKLGALFASVLYNYIDTQTKFYVVTWFGLAGALITWVFLPDTTGLDLHEQERRWAFLRRGEAHNYHGPAAHPKHLSLWERWHGLGKHFDAKLDFEQKVDEMRGQWEEQQERKGRELTKEEEIQLAEEEYSEDIHGFFSRTSKNPAAKGGVAEKPLETSSEDNADDGEKDNR
ncbi:major facilitator superfamily domain-containing protein [Lineolata rhizophorae]|uniref:Major facilitator superfamily domain-containing protein n=1 Tax=Lineolata rhizophorae TaxID=578093 RepID=A0A6A6NLD6_9PEZI|nr:major facilitator superfamily domain-containing protein [Lineolata rhizophorae]